MTALVDPVPPAPVPAGQPAASGPAQTPVLGPLVRQGLAGLAVLLAFTVVLGLAYPGAVWLAGRAVPARADGSLVRVDGSVVGSSLIGQSFEGPGWFQPRPSAAGDGYDALASGASNLGPQSADLLALVRERRAEVAAREGVAPALVPPDALTASASGLDPDISPQYAAIQVARVARERGLPVERVEELVARHTDRRQLGFLGEPRVHVVPLNADIAALSG